MDGAILRLAWQQGLSRDEIQRLVWTDVALEEGQLRLPDRAIPLETDCRDCLERRREKMEQASPFVVISERRCKPMPPESISRLARNALNAAGMTDVTLGDLCREEKRTDEDTRLLAHAMEKGTISRSEAMELLGLSKVAAYERLRRLTAGGELVRIGGKYYPAGKVVPPAEHYDVIRAYLLENRAAYRQDLAKLLRIGPRQCSLILKRMVQSGQLAQTGQQYRLPDGEACKTM